MLNFNGDTAVYLLYSHARIASILKKAETTKGISIAELKQQHSIQVWLFWFIPYAMTSSDDFNLIWAALQLPVMAFQTISGALTIWPNSFDVFDSSQSINWSLVTVERASRTSSWSTSGPISRLCQWYAGRHVAQSYCWVLVRPLAKIHPILLWLPGKRSIWPWYQNPTILLASSIIYSLYVYCSSKGPIKSKIDVHKYMISLGYDAKHDSESDTLLMDSLLAGSWQWGRNFKTITVWGYSSDHAPMLLSAGHDTII